MERLLFPKVPSFRSEFRLSLYLKNPPSTHRPTDLLWFAVLRNGPVLRFSETGLRKLPSEKTKLFAVEPA